MRLRARHPASPDKGMAWRTYITNSSVLSPGISRTRNRTALFIKARRGAAGRWPWGVAGGAGEVLRLLGCAARRLHGVSPIPQDQARRGFCVMKNSRNAQIEVYKLIHLVNPKRLTLKMV